MTTNVKDIEVNSLFSKYKNLDIKVKNSFSFKEFLEMPVDVQNYFIKYKTENKFVNSYDDLSETTKKYVSREIYRKIPSNIRNVLLKNDLNEEQVKYISKLPWGKNNSKKISIQKCQQILDENHSGMTSVKEHIVRYIACQQRIGDSYGTVLLLSGPPGVGKTTIAKSISKACGREFAKISLAGISDALSLKGVSTVFSGAKPGLVIESIIRANSFSPVILLDEIDKMGVSTEHGNPENALLEVLDSYRSRFVDSFFDFEIDLSKVIFIATANDLNRISPILKDRLEIIKLGGYSKKEKIEIAQKHIIPEFESMYKIHNSEIIIPTKTLEFIIDNCTNESGVRTLKRLIKRIFETVIYYQSINESYDIELSISDICKMLSWNEKSHYKKSFKNSEKNKTIKKPEDLLW